MIKRFHALYVGQIELDNLGRDGTPANDRRYSNERLSEVFETSRTVARAMDELGYYCLWAAEHHFQREGYECIPNLIQWGLWLATQTRRLKIGSAFNILPMWHPIRLAEDYAMADIVTDGRLIMGVGRGYHNREYYESPPPVPYRGYDLKEITMVPRPKHLPVEVWMPIASGRTIDMMAQYGLNAMVTLNGEKILDDVVRAFHDACHRHNRPTRLGEDMIWGAGIYLADTQKEAMRRLEPSHDERYKWFAPFGFVRYADEEGRTWGTPGAPASVPSLAEGVKQKAWFCGPPDQVIAGIKSIEARYPGLEDFMIHWAEGLPPGEFIEQLRWFARDVMPAFNRN